MELKMKKQDQNINYKAFIPIGITFMGAGVTFMVAVNPGVGAGLIAVGVAFMIVGVRKSKDNQNPQ
jgi:mannitol-specific phosphotransferase system IIBC component